MQVTELLRLAEWFDFNIVDNQIPHHYISLYNKMNQNLRRNGNQPFMPFEVEKENLLEAIEDITLKSLSLEQISFLDSLGLPELIGANGVEGIEKVLVENRLDLASATQKIKEFADNIANAQKVISEIETVLSQSFEIDDDEELREDQVLMRVYFQNNVSIDNLSDFKKLSANWYDIGRGIALAQDKSPEDFQVIGAKKGSIIIEMAVVVGLATTVSKILLEALKVADRFVNVLKQVEELKALKLSNKALAIDLRKEAEKEKELGIETILSEAKSDLQLNESTDGEKITALEKSIKKLIDFTKEGGAVDFVQPDESNEEEPSEIRDQVRKLNDNVKEIRLLEDRIKLLENKNGKS